MLTIVERVLFLKSVDIFRHIPGESLASVAEIAEEVSFEKRTTLLKKGETGKSLFIVLSGEVSVSIDGEEVARLGEKECFGEMALLDSEPVNASVEALEEVDLLQIDQEDFYDLLAERIEISQGLIRVLIRRLRAADRKVTRRISAASKPRKKEDKGV